MNIAIATNDVAGWDLADWTAAGIFVLTAAIVVAIVAALVLHYLRRHGPT